MKIRTLALYSAVLAIFAGASANAQTYYPSPSQAAMTLTATTTQAASGSDQLSQTPASTSINTTTNAQNTSGGNPVLNYQAPQAADIGSILRNSGISVMENASGTMTISIARSTLINLLQQMQTLLAQLNLRLMARI